MKNVIVIGCVDVGKTTLIDAMSCQEEIIIQEKKGLVSELVSHQNENVKQLLKSLSAAEMPYQPDFTDGKESRRKRREKERKEKKR